MYILFVIVVIEIFSYYLAKIDVQSGIIELKRYKLPHSASLYIPRNECKCVFHLKHPSFIFRVLYLELLP